MIKEITKITKLPEPIKFAPSPDNEVIAVSDGVSANFSETHDRLNIVDDETGFSILHLRLNGMNPCEISAKYVY